MACNSRGSSCTEQDRAALRDVKTADSRVTLAKLSSRVEELEAIIKSKGQEHNPSVGVDLANGAYGSSEASRSTSEDTTTLISGTSFDRRASTPPPSIEDPGVALQAARSASADAIADIEPISSLFDNAIVSRKFSDLIFHGNKI